MNRGRGRQAVFHDEHYYQAFLNTLGEVQLRFQCVIHAYCLMGNHYHLLLKTPRGNLSRAMRHIDGVYTQRHNRRKKTDGPLFRGRYKAIVVEANRYLLQVSRYIHRNPIELKTPLVKELAAYPWSSYAAYLNRVGVPEWLYRDTVYAELGSYQRYSAYRRYVEDGNDEETFAFYRRHYTPLIWGSKTFKEKTLAQVRRIDKEVTTKGAQDIIPMAQVISTVGDYYRLSPQELLTAKRGEGNETDAALDSDEAVPGKKQCDLARNSRTV